MIGGLFRRLAPWWWMLLALAGSGAGATEAACTHEIRTVASAERSAWRDGRLVARETVELPDRLPAAWRDESLRLVYRFELGACGATANAALWLFRVGGPYRLRIDGRPVVPTLPPSDAWLAHADERPDDGIVVGPEDAVPDVAPTAVLNGRSPSLFTLPAGSRRAEVEVLTLPYLSAGIARAELGPVPLLVPRHVAEVEILPGVNDKLAAVALAVGVGVLLLWPLRRQDLQLLWFALCCLAWGLRGHFYATTPLPLPPLFFEQMVPLLTMVASIALAITTLAWMDRLGRRRLQLAVGVLLLGLAAFAAAGLAGRGAVLARAYGFGCGMLLMPWLIAQLWSARRRLGRGRAALLAASYVVALGCAVHDMGMVLGYADPAGMSYLLPGFAAMLVCTAAMLAEYALRQLNRAERSNDELERRIAEKSRSLEESYAQRREHERGAARALERERLLREMHDGLGGQLMTVLRGVERGAMPREQVLQALQDSLDDLRLLMDSADVEQPLPLALGAWRSRWEPRLSSVGIALDWEVEDVLDPVLLAPGATLHLMRIVQEATVNVVKHARATRLELTAGRAADGAVWLRVCDDGVGLPVDGAAPAERAGGRGLANMAARARQLGARLEVGPAAEGGLGVSLTLPSALVLPLDDADVRRPAA